MSESHPNTASLNTITIDLEQLRPDPEKTAKEHLRDKLLMSGAGALALGGVAFIAGMGVRAHGSSVPAAVAGTAGAIIGGALGYMLGGTSKTYEEQVYNLIVEGSKNQNPTKGVQAALLKDLKHRDDQAAAAAYIAMS